VDENEKRNEVRRQARVGDYNRRVARELENGNRAYALAGMPEAPYGEFFCTCGRPGCEEIIVLALPAYGEIREKPYRFLVAVDHATEVDEVIERTGEYDVVEVKPEYRDAISDADTTPDREADTVS
jgi:hypothetical protein